NWDFWDADTLIYAASQNGAWTLNSYHLKTHRQIRICDGFSVFSHISCASNAQSGPCAALFTGSPTASNAPSYLTQDLGQWHIHRITQSTSPLADADISVPRSFWFDTSGGEQAHLWYYPPTNANYCDNDDSKPPLIVLGHGGPTGATDTALNLKIQFWTSRGFAVADVNYRGSTGFGRDYRQRLNRQWGVLDVDDLCAAAEFLVTETLVHPSRKVIKGSSAGGYSVLAALTQHTTFDAGVSLYGIADLEALAKDTHKFEAHYLDGLIGLYPDEKAVYQTRSPINHIDGLNCPILVAQGLDDKVVPPEQAELIVQAAKRKGVPVEYLPFSGEGHGFRQAGTIIELFTREHAFYCRTLKL
ncbi:MAG TPA: prolyl oligopeptidase family serine peptidase, partial [Marinagarivorans sp.]